MIGSATPTAATTAPVLPRTPNRPACRARITNPAMPTTARSSASVSKTPAAPISLIGLVPHSSPMHPRGMGEIMTADTTNKAPPNIAAGPAHRTILADNSGLLRARNCRNKRMVAPCGTRCTVQMGDLRAVRSSGRRCRTSEARRTHFWAGPSASPAARASRVRGARRWRRGTPLGRRSSTRPRRAP